MSRATPPVQRKTPPGHHFKIAHRGASAYEPENTLRAFRRALELGADGIELDVRRSADGHLVVIHDSQVDQTTNGSGAVAEMTLEQLRSLDAGCGERIPTLEETLDEFASRCLLLIELKGEGTETPTADMVRAKGAVSQVIISSFDMAKVARVKEYAPEIETAILTGNWEMDLLELAERARADCVQLGWERHPAPHTLLTPELFRRMEDAGLKVLLWHEERPEVIRALADMPIYGLCGNAPDLL